MTIHVTAEDISRGRENRRCSMFDPIGLAASRVLGPNPMVREDCIVAGPASTRYLLPEIARKFVRWCEAGKEPLTPFSFEIEPEVE